MVGEQGFGPIYDRDQTAAGGIMTQRSTPAAEYLAEARRLMPFPYQAFDRVCFVDAALKRDDAQICYSYPPREDDRE